MNLPRGVIVLVLVSLLATVTCAQDLKFTEPQWVDPDNAPDTLPVFKRLEPPELPRQLRQLAEAQYAEFRLRISETGKILSVSCASTTPWLMHDYVGFGEVGPAKRHEKPVACEVVMHLIYNPRPASAQTPRDLPRLVKITPPVNPRSRDSGSTTDVQVELKLTVDAAGVVTAAEYVGEPEDDSIDLIDAAKSAVATWRFEPVVSPPVPEARAVQIPVLFSAPPLSSRTDPVVKLQVKPKYPYAMLAAGIVGEVIVQFTVLTDGRVRDAYVFRSSHPGFDEAAVEAVERWEFVPAEVDGKPVDSTHQVPIVFGINGNSGLGQSRFRVGRPKEFPADLPEQFHFDQPPELKSFAVPQYPREALMENRAEKVMVVYVIGPDGRVHRAQAVKPKHMDLAQAAVAAVEAYEFFPASRQGQPGFAMMRIELDFRPSGSGAAPVSSETQRILRLLRSGTDQFASVKELDEMPEPRSRRPPTSPLATRKEHPSGKAVLEFVIDRRGFVRLPRVVEATHPAFGYAAVQAVSTWRFAPPKKGGKPVDAIAKIPLLFEPAKD